MPDESNNGLTPAFVIKRELDPINDLETQSMEVLGRVKVSIPGEMGESPWAWPLSFGGAKHRGKNDVPPIGALVVVFRVKGDDERLLYMPASHANGQTFPEFVHPDVSVEGDENYRFVRDRRPEQNYAAMQVIEKVDGAEELICEIRFDIKGRGLRIFATTGMLFETVGQMEFEAAGDIIIGGRLLARKQGNID